MIFNLDHARPFVTVFGQVVPALMFLFFGSVYMYAENFGAASMAFIGMLFYSSGEVAYLAMSKVADDAIAQTRKTLDLCSQINDVATDNRRIAERAIAAADTLVAGLRK